MRSDLSSVTKIIHVAEFDFLRSSGSSVMRTWVLSGSRVTAESVVVRLPKKSSVSSTMSSSTMGTSTHCLLLPGPNVKSAIVSM